MLFRGSSVSQAVRSGTHAALEQIDPWGAAPKESHHHRRHCRLSDDAYDQRSRRPSEPTRYKMSTSGRELRRKDAQLPPRPAYKRNEPARRIRPDEFDPERRARHATGAERAMYRQQGYNGELEQQRQQYREKMRRDDYVQNDTRMVEYKVGGKRFYAHEHPQFNPVEQVKARYEVGLQHEARMMRKGLDPYADRMMTSNMTNITATPLNRVAAIPKDEFDNMFQKHREADFRGRGSFDVEDVAMFSIPNARNNDEWFRIDLKKHAPRQTNRNEPRRGEPSCGSKRSSDVKSKKTKGSSSIFRRFSNWF